MPEMLKERNNWVVWGISGAAPKATFSPANVLSDGRAAAKAGIRET